MFNIEAVTVDFTKIDKQTIKNVRQAIEDFVPDKFLTDAQIIHLLQTAVPNWILIPGLVWGFDKKACDEMSNLLNHDIYKLYIKSL